MMAERVRVVLVLEPTVRKMGRGFPCDQRWNLLASLLLCYCFVIALLLLCYCSHDR